MDSSFFSAQSKEEKKISPVVSFLNEYRPKKRPDFSNTINLSGSRYPISRQYFKKDAPLFIGREKQLQAVCEKLVADGVQIIIGSPGIGKTTLALAYAHSYGSDQNFYPGGIFWFRFSGQTPEAAFSDFAQLHPFSIKAGSENILKDKLHEKLKKLHEKQHRMLFVFDEVENYAGVERYLELFEGIDHHIIITSWHRKWPSKFDPLKLREFSKDEGKLFIKRHLKKFPLDEQCQFLAEKFDYYPQSLCEIVSYINESKYAGSLDSYIKKNCAKELEKFRKANNQSVTRSSSDEGTNEPQQRDAEEEVLYEIHRHKLASTLTTILTKYESDVLKILAVGCFFDNNDIPKNLFPVSKKTKPDPIILLHNLFLLEDLGQDHYKIPRGIQNAMRTILEINQNSMETSKDKKNYEIKNINLEQVFLEAVSIIEQYLPVDFTKNQPYDQFEPYVSHVLCLRDAFMQYSKANIEIDKLAPRIAELLLNCAHVYNRKGLYRDACNIALKSLRLAKRCYGDNAKELIIHYLIYARMLTRQSDYHNAERVLKKAVNIGKKQKDLKNKLDYAVTLSYLGSLLIQKGNNYYEEAKVFITEAVKILRNSIKDSAKDRKLKSFNQHHLALAKCHAGDYQTKSGMFKLAIGAYKEAYQITVDHYKEEQVANRQSEQMETHPLVTLIQQKMAISYYLLGKYDKAEKKLKEVVATYEKMYKTKEHEDVVSSKVNLGKVFFWKGNYQDAWKEFVEVLDLSYAKCEYLDLNIIDAIYYQGRLLVVQGHYNEALKKFSTALIKQLQIYLPAQFQIYSPNDALKLLVPHPKLIKALAGINIKNYQRIINNEVAKVIHHIGVAFYKLRKYEIAELFYKEALAINEYTTIKHPKAFLSNLGLAKIYYQKGDYHTAEKQLQEILQKQTDSYQPQNIYHFEIGNTRRWRMKIYLRKGEYANALTEIAEAQKIWKKLKDNEHSLLPEMLLTDLGEGYLAWYAEHNYQKAEMIFRNVLKQQQNLYQNKSHPCVAQTKANLGRIMYLHGNYAAAAQLYWEAKQMLKDQTEEEIREQPFYANLAYYIGEIYYQLWCYLNFNPDYLKKAKALFSDVRNIYGVNHPETVRVLCALSRMAIDAKQYSEASAYLDQAISILKNVFDKEVLERHPLYALVLAIRSKVLSFDVKKLEEAEKVCQDAARCLQDNFAYAHGIYEGPNEIKYHPRIIDIYFTLASIQHKQGKDCSAILQLMLKNYSQRYDNTLPTDINAFLSIIKKLATEKNSKPNIEQFSDLLRILTSLKEIKPDEKDICDLYNWVKESITANLYVVLENPLFETASPILSTTQRSVPLINKHVCILGGMKDPPVEQIQAVKKLGESLVKEGFIPIYGGESPGTMQALSDSIFTQQGKIIAIITSDMIVDSRINIEVESLYVEKTQRDCFQKMLNLATAFIVLPGGLQVLSQVTEIITSEHSSKPIALFNIGNFYNSFFDTLLQCQKSSSDNDLRTVTCTNNVANLLEFIINFKLPDKKKSSGFGHFFHPHTKNVEEDNNNLQKETKESKQEDTSIEKNF